MENLKDFENFWKFKNILITGHSGFKGSWLTILLKKLGANITGISLDTDKNESLFYAANINKICENHFCDINNKTNLEKIILKNEPDIIFHLAAQPLVIESYKKPLSTLKTNIIGTSNLLEIIRKSNKTKVVVIITSDKVYSNLNDEKFFEEKSILGGKDIYSASKAACELIVNAYNHSFLNNLNISTARAGNVIGGGDWADNRLIPDIMRSIKLKKTLDIRNPTFTRPWQHVLDPIMGYLILAQKMWHNKINTAFNFGPKSKKKYSVKDIVLIAKKKFPELNLNFVKNYNGPNEARALQLNASKAKKILSFYPTFSFEQSIDRTFNWYYKFYKGNNAHDLCMDDINYYFKSLKK